MLIAVTVLWLLIAAALFVAAARVLLGRREPAGLGLEQRSITAVFMRQGVECETVVRWPAPSWLSIPVVTPPVVTVYSESASPRPTPFDEVRLQLQRIADGKAYYA